MDGGPCTDTSFRATLLRQFPAKLAEPRFDVKIDTTDIYGVFFGVEDFFPEISLTFMQIRQMEKRKIFVLHMINFATSSELGMKSLI